jgi:16S rRNA (guanine(966)-N(2))-methyltransferase RsmD
MQKKSAPRQVRIIAGQWKRTPVTVVDAPGLRPTPDRVRETVFNWLNFIFDNNWQTRRCLDLFAGSGALGFESASRGALHVTLVENHPQAVQQLEQLRDKLHATQLQIIRGDATSVAKKLAVAMNDSLSQSKDKFDVIFLDPPFHRDMLTKVLPDCVMLLKADGLLYLEAEKSLESADLPECLNNWQVIRCDRAGMVFFHLLQRIELQQIQA